MEINFINQAYIEINSRNHLSKAGEENEFIFMVIIFITLNLGCSKVDYTHSDFATSFYIYNGEIISFKGL